MRRGAVPRSGTQRTVDCVAWSDDAWADTSTCWPRPDRALSVRARRAPLAASPEACRKACGRLTRTGARSLSPVMSSAIDDAQTVSSVAGMFAFGPS